MSISCGYYHGGMCLYINRKIAIYEKCHCKDIPKKSLECKNKKTIQMLEERVR